MAFAKYPPTNISEAITVFKQDVELAHGIVHGDENTEVLTENGLVPSFKNVIEFLKDEVASATGVDVSLRDDLADTNSTVLVGGVESRDISKVVSSFVTPEMFGAVGGNVTLDTSAWVQALQSGKKVIGKKGRTYNVSTIYVRGVDNIDVDASGCIIQSTFGHVVIIADCDNPKWVGGSVIAGTGVNPTIYDAEIPATYYAFPFQYFGCTNFHLKKLVVANKPDYTSTCITVWSCQKGAVEYCRTSYGGDNSIFIFVSEDVNTCNNICTENQRGRTITYQGCIGGAILGNIVSNGFGDGISVHGSSNLVVSDNVVFNMEVDNDLLGTSRGISVEWNETATVADLDAAANDLYLINRAFSRNVTISNNTIVSCVVAAKVGDNNGPAGSFGNIGVVVFEGNTLVNCGQGIDIGRSSYVTVKGGKVADMQQSLIIIDLSPDAAGRVGNNVIVDGVDMSQPDKSSMSFPALRFIGDSTYSATRNISFTKNEFKNASIISNLPLSLVFGRGSGNTILDKFVVSQTIDAGVKTRLGIGADDIGASASTVESKSYTEFVFSGNVGDSFTTIFQVPPSASIIVELQIGIADRTMQVGTFYAHNNAPAASSFTGIGSGYVQMSGASLQIKGNTSGGSAPYGGDYSMLVKLLRV